MSEMALFGAPSYEKIKVSEKKADLTLRARLPERCTFVYIYNSEIYPPYCIF